ncbi:hypothetical protein J6590_031509 [Homalodisca vitripennis]|nr:hypothetical protein J6590_031509 [Homalodisca vitripennis]
MRKNLCILLSVCTEANTFLQMPTTASHHLRVDFIVRHKFFSLPQYGSETSSFNNTLWTHSSITLRSKVGADIDHSALSANL